MPHNASAKKRMRTSERDRRQNRSVKSHIRRAIKDLLADMGTDEAPESLSYAHSMLDRASKKSVLHPKKVDRMKSRLAKAVHRAAQEE